MLGSYMGRGGAEGVGTYVFGEYIGYSICTGVYYD